MVKTIYGLGSLPRLTHGAVTNVLSTLTFEPSVGAQVGSHTKTMDQVLAPCLYKMSSIS
jgi:hypothetical protein